MTVPTATPATQGTFAILVTNGATVLNVNQFAGGYLVVASGTGIGQTLEIASHQAAAASATFIVTTADPITVTLDATSKVSLVANPAKNVIIMPTTPSAVPVGVTLYAMPASVANTYNATYGTLTTAGTPQYGFVVSHGPVGCLIDSSVTGVCYPLGAKTATAGALGIATLTSSPQLLDKNAHLCLVKVLQREALFPRFGVRQSVIRTVKEKIESDRFDLPAQFLVFA